MKKFNNVTIFFFFQLCLLTSPLLGEKPGQKPPQPPRPPQNLSSSSYQAYGRPTSAQQRTAQHQPQIYAPKRPACDTFKEGEAQGPNPKRTLLNPPTQQPAPAITISFASNDSDEESDGGYAPRPSILFGGPQIAQPNLTHPGTAETPRVKRPRDEDSEQNKAKRLRCNDQTPLQSTAEQQGPMVSLLTLDESHQIQIPESLASKFSGTIQAYLALQDNKSMPLNCDAATLAMLEEIFATIHNTLQQEGYQNGDPTEQCSILEKAILEYLAHVNNPCESIPKLKNLACFLDFPVLLTACESADSMLEIGSWFSDYTQQTQSPNLNEFVEVIIREKTPTESQIIFLKNISQIYSEDLLIVAHVLETLYEFILHKDNPLQPSLEAVISHLDEKHTREQEFECLQTQAQVYGLTLLDAACDARTAPERRLSRLAARSPSPLLPSDDESADKEIIAITSSRAITSLKDLARSAFSSISSNDKTYQESENED